ncbi:alpha/beta hydrolase [Flavobacterium ardleyense]|uniref:Alpha/beta hydrolase n=1 Tax=Flavobacterium ardleyense TaxID=2038737 RepID=A0ABW5ZBX9_9FLAO
MKNIYIFSGLGADKRVFQNMDFSGFNVKFVEWILPDENETIEKYAKRLAEEITHERPILIGLSFGGIIATEIGKIIATEKIILIASAKNKNQIPYYYRIAGKLKLHKLVPTKLLKLPNVFSYWFFGIENKQDKDLLKEILKDTDEKFLKWAIDKIVTWDNIRTPTNSIHIHGNSDRILPINFIDFNIEIENGGHFMTLNKATELSKIVRKEILVP